MVSLVEIALKAGEVSRLPSSPLSGHWKCAETVTMRSDVTWHAFFPLGLSRCCFPASSNRVNMNWSLAVLNISNVVIGKLWSSESINVPSKLKSEEVKVRMFLCYNMRINTNMHKYSEMQQKILSIGLLLNIRTNHDEHCLSACILMRYFNTNFKQLYRSFAPIVNDISSVQLCTEVQKC